MNKEERQRRMKDRIRSCKSALPALAQALKDPDTPKRARWLCALAVGYALSPLDLIPDFIPVLGALDDLLLLPLLITLAVKCIPADVWLAAGFTERVEGDGCIIPNYLTPPVHENTEYYYFTNKPESFVLFKADGDQDRPNLK